MTSIIESNRGYFYVNNPQTKFTTAANVWIKSQYSQEYEGPFRVGAVEQNERYAELSVDFEIGFDEKHKNGYYTYYIGEGIETEPSIIYHEDIVKIITEPGGNDGSKQYESTNDGRVSDVYYRPNY